MCIIRFASKTLFLAIFVFVGVTHAEEKPTNDRVNSPLENFPIEAIKAETPPKIDGLLTDSCWSMARPITDFTQWQPVIEELPTESTVCYLTYDQEYLYFAAKCFDSRPEKVTANLSRRDDMFGDDWVILLIDTYNDQRSAYEFAVNPCGIQGDLINTGNSDDESWDAVWSSAGKRTDFGWQAEMAIPFRALRYSKADVQTWRFQVVRYIARKQEKDSYVPLRKVDNTLLSRTAELKGIKGIKRGQHFDLLPYVTGRNTQDTLTHWKFDTGIDAKLGISSNLITDLTINPDYGQIEADPDQINLTPYELYLQEKRPFFLEKMDVFHTPYSLFYSRRISDPLAGAKITGKLSKYSIGALYALNDDKNLDYNENFTVLRLKGDVFEQSQLGFLLTDKEYQSYYNRVLAGDWNLILGNFTFTGQIANSQTKDTKRLSWIGRGSLTYSRNNLTLEYAHRFYENNFLTEAGFVTPTIVDWSYVPVSYRYDIVSSYYQWQINHGGFRSISPSLGYYYKSAYEGEILYRSICPHLNFSFEKNVSFNLEINSYRELWENKYYDQYYYYLDFSANPTGYLNIGTSFTEGKSVNYWYNSLGWNRQFSFWCTWKPMPKFELSPEIYHASQYTHQHGERIFDQWIGLTRISYLFTKDAYLKLFLQSNSLDNYYVANVLFGYTFKPGSTFYLAYNSGYDNSTHRFKKDSQIIFVKASYLFQL